MYAGFPYAGDVYAGVGSQGVVTVVVTESFTFSDSQRYEAEVRVADAFSVADTAYTAQSLEVGDSFSFADSMRYEIVQTVTDAFTFSDSVYAAFTIEMTDSFSFSDSLGGTEITQIVNDSFVFTDSLTVEMDDVILTEAFTFADSVSYVMNHIVTDSFTMADSLGTPGLVFGEEIYFQDHVIIVKDGVTIIPDTWRRTDVAPAPTWRRVPLP